MSVNVNGTMRGTVVSTTESSTMEVTKMNDFSEIIGYETIVKDLKQICDVLKNRDVYTKLGVTMPRGLMLYGEPGVGKTLMANSFVKAVGRETFTCRKDKPNGDFVKAIKETFENAANAAPSVVFLDDMDKFASGNSRHDDDAEEYVTVQSCIDEVNDKEIFVIATANDIDDMPDSLLRAGRFDRVIEVGEPSIKDAEKIIAHYMGQKKFVDNLDSESVARVMHGRSVAELETVINYAGLYAGYERSEVITMNHFMKACLHMLYDIPEDVFLNRQKCDLKQMSHEMKEIVYHEAGHATVCEVLDPGAVSLCTVYGGRQHGHGANGFTSTCHSNEWYEMHKYMPEVMVGLGGIAATEQNLGSPDLGCSSDIRKAKATISDAVKSCCEGGFSLMSPGRPWESCSNDLVHAQETVISEKLEQGYRKTKELLALNKDLFQAIAEALAQKSILTQEDFREIRRHCTIVPVAI